METEICLGTLGNDAASSAEDAQQGGVPERRLLLAILERAILDFVGNEPKEVESASEWFFGDRNSREALQPPAAFSFGWVCEALDLDPQRVAAFVSALPKRGRRRIAPWYFMDRAEVEAVTDRIVKACAGVH